MSKILIETLASVFALKGENDLNTGITLSVNGSIISGKLTTKEDFLSAPENVLLKTISDGLKKTLEKNNIQEEDDVYESHLYLKQASYYSGTQKLPHSGTYIAVSVDSIDSFSMGCFG